MLNIETLSAPSYIPNDSRIYALKYFAKCDMPSDTSDEPEITDLSDTTDCLVCNTLNVNSLYKLKNPLMQCFIQAHDC